MTGWESRLFVDADLTVVLDVLRTAFRKVKAKHFASRPLSQREARTDVYVVLNSAVHGLKFRDGMWLELKTRDDLLGVDEFCLSELWRKQPTPGSHLAALFAADVVDDSAFDQLADALAELQPAVARLLRQQPRRRVFVRKTRWSIDVGSASLEVAELDVHGRRVVSLCLEGSPPMKMCKRLLKISDAFDKHKIRHDVGGYPRFLRDDTDH